MFTMNIDTNNREFRNYGYRNLMELILFMTSHCLQNKYDFSNGELGGCNPPIIDCIMVNIN